MHFSHVGAAIVLASVSQAILLPPTISAADADIVNTLPFEHEAEADGRLFAIDCPFCSVIVEDLAGDKHRLDSQSMLQFNFSITHGDRDQLDLNGVQIYPINIESASFSQPLSAPQVVELVENNWQQVSEPSLGYSLQISHPAKDSEDQQFGLVSVKLDIIEVADQLVNGFPSMEMKLLETPGGKLMIGDLQILPSKDISDVSECTTLLCKWRAIIAEKVGKFKGCGRKPGSRPQRQGHGYPHGSHRFQHYRQHRFHLARILRSVVLQVLIPVCIGIMAGVSASILGMIVGHLAIFIWRALFRRNSAKCQYARYDQEDVAVVGDKKEEVKGLMEHQGPPPVYEEVIVIDEKSSE